MLIFTQCKNSIVVINWYNYISTFFVKQTIIIGIEGKRRRHVYGK